MRMLKLGSTAMAPLIAFAACVSCAGSAAAQTPTRPAAASPAAGPPLAAGSYTTIAIPGGTQVMATGISDSGVIIGCFQSAHGQRGLVDRQGRISTIADPAAGPHGGTCPLTINDFGVIVGSYARSTGPTHGFVDRHGKFTSITAPGAGTHPGAGTLAVGINDSNVIVGFTISLKPGGGHGFVLKNGKFSLVKVPTGKHSVAVAGVLNGISDNGTITGTYLGKNDLTHSFIDRAGKFVTIAVPHAFQTFVACVSSNSREVVGIYTTTKAGTVNHGFTYRSGTYCTLRDPAGKAGTTPQCVNNAGVVVGYYNFKASATATRGFRFTPRTPAKSPGQ